MRQDLSPVLFGHHSRRCGAGAPSLPRSLRQGWGFRRRDQLWNLSRLFLRSFRLTRLVRHAHAAQHVVGEEELAVSRHHHDLKFVRQSLGHDFVDQQRILLQNRRLARHPLRIGSGRHSNGVRLCLRQQLSPFGLGLAVDDLGLGRGFRVLNGRFLPCFGFQFALLDLFLFQRQGVLHRIGFALSLQDVDLRLAFGLLDLLYFRRFGFEFRDAYLFLLQLCFHAHAVVFLLFQQQSLQPFRVFLRQLDVPQHHFFHHDSVSRQFLRDHACRPLSHFFPFSRENIAHRVVRNQFAPDAGHDRRNNLLLHGTRQVALNVFQSFGIETITHRNRKTKRQPLLGLYVEQLRFGRDIGRSVFSILRDSRGEDLIPRVEQRYVLDQRHHKMRARIQRARHRPTHLADADSRHAARHHHTAEGQQNRSPRQQNHPEATGHHQILQRQHRRSPLRLSASALISPRPPAGPACLMPRTDGTLAQRSVPPPATPPRARKSFLPPPP